MRKYVAVKFNNLAKGYSRSKILSAIITIAALALILATGCAMDDNPISSSAGNDLNRIVFVGEVERDQRLMMECENNHCYSFSWVKKTGSELEMLNFYYDDSWSEISWERYYLNTAMIRIITNDVNWYTVGDSVLYIVNRGYTYQISGSTLTLTDDAGVTTIFTKMSYDELNSEFLVEFEMPEGSWADTLIVYNNQWDSYQYGEWFADHSISWYFNKSEEEPNKISIWGDDDGIGWFRYWYTLNNRLYLINPFIGDTIAIYTYEPLNGNNNILVLTDTVTDDVITLSKEPPLSIRQGSRQLPKSTSGVAIDGGNTGRPTQIQAGVFFNRNRDR